MISGVSCRGQGENRISNEDMRTDLSVKVDSVGEVARRSSLKWFDHVELIDESSHNKSDFISKHFYWSLSIFGSYY